MSKNYSKRLMRAPMQAITFAEGQDGPVEKVQLFRTGTFHHAEYGKFQITPRMLGEMKSNFDNRVRGIDLAIDYKHDSEDVAAGWIKDLYLSEDGQELWAVVSWTPNGGKVLTEKEFRYLSPEFIMNYKDNETLKSHGPTLLGAGLTNRPTIKKMEPVVELTEVFDNKTKNSVTVTKKTFKLGDYKMQNMQVMDQEQLAAMPQEELVKLAMALMAKVKEMDGMGAEMADMKKKVAAMEDAKACSEKKAQFEKLLVAGKVCKAQEEAFLTGDVIKFAEAAVALDGAAQAQGTGTQPPVEGTPADVDPQDKVLELAKAKLETKEVQTLAEGIRKTLSENPELNKRIYG